MLKERIERSFRDRRDLPGAIGGAACSSARVPLSLHIHCTQTNNVSANPLLSERARIPILVRCTAEQVRHQAHACRSASPAQGTLNARTRSSEFARARKGHWGRRCIARGMPRVALQGLHALARNLALASWGFPSNRRLERLAQRRAHGPRYSPPKRRLHAQRHDNASPIRPTLLAFSGAYSRIRTIFNGLSR